MAWLLFTVPFFALWRRWFGSDTVFLEAPRSVKCAVFLITSCYVCFNISGSELQSIAFSGLGYLFFCLAIGMCFDLGRDGLPDEELLKRYNKYVWHYLPDLILKNHKYGFLYDLVYMLQRYTIPALAIALLPIFKFSFVGVGLSIAFVYAFCWTLHEKEQWFLDKIPYTNGKPTANAEYVSGALFGLFPLFIGG